jgi:Winged helix-turn helix
MNADGHGVMAIMREVGVSKTTVWRWQEYFVEDGVEGHRHTELFPGRAEAAVGDFRQNSGPAHRSGPRQPDFSAKKP